MGGHVFAGLETAIGSATDYVVGQAFDYFGWNKEYQDEATMALSVVTSKGKPNKVSTKTALTTANGIGVSGFAKHGLNRAIQRGVKPDAILDALKNPLKTGNIVTDQLGRQSQRFIGRHGEVVINPQTGQIISVNPTSSSKVTKLLSGQ